jgi:hypothetical protein
VLCNCGSHDASDDGRAEAQTIYDWYWRLRIAVISNALHSSVIRYLGLWRNAHYD